MVLLDIMAYRRAPGVADLRLFRMWFGAHDSSFEHEVDMRPVVDRPAVALKPRASFGGSAQRDLV